MQWVSRCRSEDAAPGGWKGITIVGDAHSPASRLLQCMDVGTQHLTHSLAYHLPPPEKGKPGRMSTVLSSLSPQTMEVPEYFPS